MDCSEDIEQVRQRLLWESAFLVLLDGYPWGAGCLRETAARFMPTGGDWEPCLAWQAESVNSLVILASLPILSSLALQRV